MKRVLLTTFPTAFLHYGGGEREIHLLNEALNAAGLVSDIYGPTSRPLDTYDCVVHFSMLDGSEQVIDAVSSPGRRLVLWPNLWFVGEPDPQHLLRLSRLLARFDAVVFRSTAEEEHFGRYLPLAGRTIIRVSPLISQKFSRKNVSTVFQESYGLDRYALWPGIIEPQKNQLSAVRAFSDIDVDLVISGWVRNQDYWNECRRAANGNTHFIPAMPFCSELHLSALAHCSLFVELSLDFPGTSALEAAVMGCPLLLARSPWTEEMLGRNCRQVDGLNIVAVRTNIVEMMGAASSPRTECYFPEMARAVEPLRQYLVA